MKGIALMVKNIDGAPIRKGILKAGLSLKPRSLSDDLRPDSVPNGMGSSSKVESLEVVRKITDPENSKASSSKTTMVTHNSFEPLNPSEEIRGEVVMETDGAKSVNVKTSQNIEDPLSEEDDVEEESSMDEERFLKQKSKVNWLATGGEVPKAFVNHYEEFLGCEGVTGRLPTPDLFVRGDKRSAKVIMDSLQTFASMSGLTPSVQKSTVFFCNVNLSVRLEILNILPFEEGKLPVKYLGVPLIASRLLYRDCKVLVERLEKRVSDWKNRFLSFAGRCQLILSVMSSMHIYWSSMFILPARVLKEIEGIMRGFLWCQGPMKRGKAKISWNDVCVPKSEGGLGIKRVGQMNKSLMAYHIWSILTKRESLWVDWIYKHRLKGRSFWSITIPHNCSWSWRKLLQIRLEFRAHFWFKVDIWCSSVICLHVGWFGLHSWGMPHV
ncbi:hypothetical protein QVD17_41545 [Tagetes erecta]|uniref:Reverse transcriptase n=1 Tax=Tagetes erecta TaxID=13708 RepID=A0AAD8JKT0_TARER|nr:hypothetical protein QVD17_41545 [Tagetes erecta]